MTELEAKIRGDEKWTLIPSDDAAAELTTVCATMKNHGFKVVRGEQGERRVINPYTGQCEVIYRLRTL